MCVDNMQPVDIRIAKYSIQSVIALLTVVDRNASFEELAETVRRIIRGDVSFLVNASVSPTLDWVFQTSLFRFPFKSSVFNQFIPCLSYFPTILVSSNPFSFLSAPLFVYSSLTCPLSAHTQPLPWSLTFSFHWN